jgi:hypothetical protein
MPDLELQRDRRPTVKACLALLAVAAALTAAGCGGDADGGPANAQTAQAKAQGRVPPKLVEETAVRGGSADDRRLLAQALDGMEQTALERIQITRGEDDAVAIEFTPVSGVTARRQWDEWIVAGALSRRLQAAGAPAAVTASSRSGAFTARPKIKGNPDPRPLAAAREEAILKAIRGAVKKSGVDLVTLEAHRPYGLAVALSVSTVNPAHFLNEKLRALLAALNTHRPRIEGIYLAVLEDRRLVLEWGSWTRNPAGTFWVRPDLADCSPIKQAGPPGTKPPPKCPAT